MLLVLKEHLFILFQEKKLKQREFNNEKNYSFGMGSFGTALANVLAQNGHDVLMWGKNVENVDELNTSYEQKLS